MNSKLKVIYESIRSLSPALVALCRLVLAVRRRRTAGTADPAGDRCQRVVGSTSSLPAVAPSVLAPLKLWWLQTTDQWTDRAPVGAKRSPQWHGVQQAHLAANPRCVCCGGTNDLRVHHIEPFHLRPDLELDPQNLITLCESKRFGINCHLLLGHLGNWRRWNPLVKFDAIRWKARLQSAYLTTAVDQIKQFSTDADYTAVKRYVRSLRWPPETPTSAKAFFAEQFRHVYDWIVSMAERPVSSDSKTAADRISEMMDRIKSETRSTQ